MLKDGHLESKRGRYLGSLCSYRVKEKQDEDW